MMICLSLGERLGKIKSVYDDDFALYKRKPRYGGGLSRLRDPEDLAWACLLLRMGWPSDRVALEVGYANSANFGKAFRRATGENPWEWQVHRGVVVRHAKVSRPCLRPRQTWSIAERREWAAERKRLRGPKQDFI